MKVCFVLSAATENLYWRMLIVSMRSVRYHHPEAEIVLLVDRPTEVSLSASLRSAVREGVIDEVVASPLTVDHDPKKNSRLLKTVLRQSVTGDLLYIDSDTFIRKPILGMASRDGVDFCAVPDLNRDEYVPSARHKDICSAMGWPLPEAPFFNSGVLYVRDTDAAHALFERFHTLWTDQVTVTGVLEDQLPLAEALRQVKPRVRRLVDELNAQVMYKPQLAKKGRVLHFFAAHPKTIPRLPTSWMKTVDAEDPYKVTIAELVEGPVFLSKWWNRFAIALLNCESESRIIAFSDWRRLWVQGQLVAAAKSFVKLRLLGA